jgi:hypothetical protein
MMRVSPLFRPDARASFDGGSTMKSIRGAVVCCVALVLSSCEAPKPEDYIVGKWEDKDHHAIEFRHDGTVIGQLRIGKIVIDVDGRYRFVDETTMELAAVSPLIPNGVTMLKVNRLDYRELSLTAQNGVMTMWTRPAN